MTMPIILIAFFLLGMCAGLWLAWAYGKDDEDDTP